MSEHGHNFDTRSTPAGAGATVDDEGSIAGTQLGALTDLTEGYGGYETARLEPGQRLGPYELERHLGSGGMGEVYSARHTTTGKEVAIKFLSRTTPRLLYRFKREFRALADVSHRNVISLGELVVPPTGAAFFTMELIDGLPFVEYVRRRARAGELPNLVRLGRALRQLVAGLGHLHDADCVHRDVKPSNVLVTREGRVVLLDFGLVSELHDEDEGISRDGQLLGTPAYMAPEQASMSQVSSATDFYAVGVLLFECLTGVLPYRGSAMEIVLLKQDEDIPDPSDLVSGIPPALRELCIGLLAQDPSQRPQRDEILDGLASRALGASEHSRPLPSAKRRDRRGRAPFVGRRAELEVLNGALQDVRNTGEAVTIHVSGESGYGKSALVGSFLAEVRATTDTMILRGRCLERESVPYKGIDSVVDSLSARLHRMFEDEVAELRPRYVAPLIQIFPVLSDVWRLDGVMEQRFEPAELRRLGLAALREVLSSIARTRPLLIHVDDFQWADVDGARVLTSLLRPPDPPAILLVVSFRAEPGAGADGSAGLSGGLGEALRELTSAEARLGRDVRELAVGPLSGAEASELAWTLMGVEDGGSIGEREELRRRADAFARGAKGNPFYIGQMVLDDDAEAGESGDDRIVARRIVQLEPAARRLLATVAVSGGPTPIAVVREVFGSKGDAAETSWSDQLAEVGEVIEKLCELGLLTRRGGEFDSSHDSATSGTLSGPLLEAAHGRIREVTVGELETDELEQIHLELGSALERLGGDADALADHFERAGELVRAATYAEQAAEQAVEALAFGRAVLLYRRVLRLLDLLEQPVSTRGQGGQAPDPARRRRLRVALAGQLVNFGRSSEAGRLLRELADEAEPSDDGPGGRLVLRRKAAEQLLHAGHVGEGLELAAVVLREIGESPPRGFWTSMWMFMWGRLRLALRGLGYRARPEAELPAAQLEHIDTLLTIYKGLVLHLEIHSWVLHNRLLRLTLDAGEPRRLATMFANEMLIVASFGGEGKVHELAGQARELAASANDVELDRTIDLQRDLVDYALNRFSDATDQLRELLPRLDDVAGADWIRFSSVLVYSSLCVITGRWAELYRNLPQWLAAARERGNLREIVELDAYAAMTELHRGDLGQARYHLDKGREAWDDTRYNYTTLMLDRVEIFMLLAEGELDRLLERIDKLLVAVSRSSVALNPVVKRFVDQLIGRCWAVVAVRRPNDAKLRAQVRKVCRRLRRTKVPLYIGEAAINEAALCSIAGDEGETRQRWREAELLFDQHRIECQLACVRWHLATVTEGRETKRFSRAAHNYFAANGVADPASIASMLVPSALAGPPDPADPAAQPG
ncbi:Serine/threonine-protein kinase PknH [Enhygromyxa salina]|uniref:Serine/threonine-protein kinase PknH n=1 Tax=Enhygromyxa salina TaxID=215803 RepID=A0A2S9XY01_9BACT|nr:serine/threonine-protein kinase [Enhygromyxa salina]PRP97713.1 Serine/threonine-protein kinase PknH [Enhygromyxa salina]